MRGTAATLVAGVLLALFGWMAASVSREHSTTADELYYVTAGYSYWKLADFRLPPEAGNLPPALGGAAAARPGPALSPARPAGVAQRGRRHARAPVFLRVGQ